MLSSQTKSYPVMFCCRNQITLFCFSFNHLSSEARHSIKMLKIFKLIIVNSDEVRSENYKKVEYGVIIIIIIIPYFKRVIQSAINVAAIKRSPV